MSEEEVKRLLAQLHCLFTEQALTMSVVLHFGISLEHMREPMIDGLQTIQASIAKTLQALQGSQGSHANFDVPNQAVAAPVAAEPGPTNGAGRSALRTALGRVLGAMKA